MVLQKILMLFTTLLILVDKFSYVGLFLLSIISNVVFIFIPFPMGPLIFTFGSRFNPLLVAIIASIGSMIGSSIKYLIGLGSKEILGKKYEKEILRVRNAFEKYNFFWWIVAIGLTPFPDDPVTIFCGMIKYDFKKYFIAMLMGRLILNFIIAYAGYYSIKSIVDILEISI